jgi:hypothetical protein
MSSTIKMLAPDMDSQIIGDSVVLLSLIYSKVRSFSASSAPMGGHSTAPCLTVTTNLLPLPYSLSTSIVPSIISTSLCVMDKPKPVPSISRLTILLKREYAVKRFLMVSRVIPCPVSVILKRSTGSPPS